MRESLLAALQTRLQAVDSTGDPATVHDSEAVAEADRLLGFLATPGGPDPVDPEVQYTVGIMYWVRAASRPEEEQLPDRIAAAQLLLPFFWGRPDVLPELVRSSIEAALQGADRPAGEAATEKAYAESRAVLAMLLLERLVRLGELAAGQSAVLLLRRAVGGLPSGHPYRPMALCNLGYALLLTALRDAGPDAAELPVPEEAVSMLRESFDTTPRDDPNYARCAYGLALALRAKGALTDDQRSLAESVGLFRTAVGAATDLDDGNLAQMLADLGVALATWVDAATSPPGLAPSELWAAADEAVSALRRSVHLTPREAGELPQRLILLAVALRSRHSLRADLAGLDEAIGALTLAAAAYPDGSTDRAEVLALTKQMIMLRAPHAVRARLDPGLRASMDYLDDVMSRVFSPESLGVAGPDGALASILRLAGFSGTPEDGPGSESGNARLMRFVTAIAKYPDEVGMAELMAMAATELEHRFRHLPPEERVDALQRFSASVEESPAGPVDLTDLEDLLTIVERVRGEMPTDHSDRPLLDLGRMTLLLNRLNAAEGSREDRMARAVELAALVQDLTQNIMPAAQARMGIANQQLEHIFALGTATQSPFEQLAGIERMVRDGRRRLARATADSSEYLDTLRALAHALFEHYSVLRDETSYQEATGYAREVVARLPPTDPSLPFFLLLWTNTVAGRVRVAGLMGPADESDAPSSGTARLASGSAASALGYGDAAGALETLEEGRAHLLSSAFNTRRELDSLRRADPELAARFLAVRERLRARQAERRYGTFLSPESNEHYRALVEDWGELTSRLRGLPDHDRFMMPLPLGLPDLLPAAAQGPVVTINVNSRRCDALALSLDGVHPVALPDLRAADVVEQADAFHEAIAVVTGGGGGLLVQQARNVITDTLGWLWDVLAQPVLEALRLTGPPAAGEPWPRLWWSPTGALTRLPLHAAGRHTEAGTSVLDRVVSSYTPTLRALMYSRAHPVRSRRPVLVVAMPETPGHPPLRRTVREARVLGDGAAGLTSLIGPAATRTAVTTSLPEAAIVHFACHAGSDPADPSASHLLLQDGALDLGTISRLQLDGAELAYLSACGTARGGTKLADEAIHAASAFQLAGYAQAVATLWEIGDEFAAAAAADFYRELSRLAPDGEPPARLPAALALHEVTRRMRDSMPERPWAWASLLHAGA